MGTRSQIVLHAATRSHKGGPWPTAKLNGREYWVVPFVSLVEGVLNGSKGPLFYPRDEIGRSPGIWNDIIVTLGHPTKDDGTPLDGKTPEAAEKFGLGRVYNDWTDPTRRGGEAWFDKDLTRSKAPEVASRLQNGEMIELSTGLGTQDFPGEGRDEKGRWYWATARNYEPNHLAVLIGQRGACSLGDGCGIGRNAECALNAFGDSGSDNFKDMQATAERKLRNLRDADPEVTKLASAAIKATKSARSKDTPEAQAKAKDANDKAAQAAKAAEATARASGDLAKAGSLKEVYYAHQSLGGAHGRRGSALEREASGGGSGGGDNCGTGSGGFQPGNTCGGTDNAMPQEKWNGICPRCGATLDENGACAACGWQPGDSISQFDPAEDPNQKPAPEYASNFALRMWDRVINAFLPGQSRSQVTGRIKRVGAGTGKGPEHQAAQTGFYKFTPSDHERELAASITDVTANPSWVADESKWEKAKGIAAESGHEEDWAYIVGIYQRMGGETKNETGSECQCGGTCSTCKTDVTQGDDAMNRNQMIAFLVANSAAWKGKEAVLNAKAGDKFVLDDASLKAMVDEVKGLQAATNALKETAKIAGAPEDIALNEMPAFIKDKMMKEDDGEEEDDEETKNKKTTNRKAPKGDQTVNLEALTPEQLDALSKRMTGMTVNEAKDAATAVRSYREKEKRIVANKLVRHLPEDKREKRVKELCANNSLEQLYDRLADMPAQTQNDSDDSIRVPVFGGRLLLDQPAPSGQSFNAEDFETFQPTPVHNWEKKGDKTAA